VTHSSSSGTATASTRRSLKPFLMSFNGMECRHVPYSSSHSGELADVNAYRIHWQPPQTQTFHSSLPSLRSYFTRICRWVAHHHDGRRAKVFAKPDAHTSSSTVIRITHSVGLLKLWILGSQLFGQHFGKSETASSTTRLERL
jgi:hypothetical protein